MAELNPFSPHFGGNPELFFGRRPILDEFDVALVSPGSDYRSLFLTGSRGSGKTCLVEQLSSKASAVGWDVLDLTADHALKSLLRKLVPYDEMTRSVAPNASLQVLGSGVSLGGVGRSESRRVESADLAELLLEACRDAKRGVFVSIDEIQKVPLDDVSTICSAFQMAARKGLDVILVVAGLPYAYGRVIAHDGCTFMRRARHLTIGLLNPDEVRDGLRTGFERVGDLEVDDGALDTLVARSLGQPYLMQLLGYETVRSARDGAAAGEVALDPPDADRAFLRAYRVYAQQALRPIVEEIGRRCVEYLTAMIQCMDEAHEASTRDVAKAMGTTTGGLARTRDRLLGQGVIVSPQRGRVRFNVPYLRDYLASSPNDEDEARLSELWDV